MIAKVYDGYTNLVGGVDGGRKPNLIDKVRAPQCAEATNAVFREGAPTSRPPFVDVVLTNQTPNVHYDDDGVFVNTTDGAGESWDVFNTGLFQEATYYGTAKNDGCIMATIGGRQFKITIGNGQTGIINEITIDRRNRDSLPLAYHLQADKYFIVQDGEGAPIIFDGVAARRAGVDEIFTGRMMAYGMGRIAMVGTDDQIYFLDLYDGKGNGAADILGATETTFLNEGFPAALPASMGLPTAVAFIPQQDAATGVGQCLVFGPRGAASFDLSIPREQWKGSFFQREALLGVGAVGHRALALSNQDLFIRSQDGWRSYRQARGETDKWAQIPLSTNVRKWVEADSPELLDHCSAINFQNRLIGTCTPYPNQGRPYHNGLLALDFDILSTFGKTSNPAWDGHWGNFNASAETGARVLRVIEGTFNGRHRAFMFRLTEGGVNHLREIAPIAALEDSDGPVTSVMRTRSMDFDTELNEKILYGGDLWIENIQQDTTISVNYRADQMPDFTTWREPFVATPIEGVPQGDATVEAEGFQPRASLPKPPDDADERTTKRLLRRFYEFQAEIIWTGRATIRKLRATGRVELEDPKAKIP